MTDPAHYKKTRSVYPPRQDLLIALRRVDLELTLLIGDLELPVALRERLANIRRHPVELLTSAGVFGKSNYLGLASL